MNHRTFTLLAFTDSLRLLPTLLAVFAFCHSSHAAESVPFSAQLTALHATDLRAKQTQSAALRSIVARAAATPASAERFFYEGVRGLEFRPGTKEASNWPAWRSEFDRQFTGGQLGRTVQFQLRFVWLTLAAAEQPDSPQLAGPWAAYVRDLASHAATLKPGAKLLSQPLAESVAGRVVRPEAVWGEAVTQLLPAQVEAIFDRHILPHCPPTSKAAAFDELLRWLDTLSRAWFTPEEYVAFQKAELVRLQWRKLSELALLDGRINAAEARALVAFLRQNKDHPASLTWIEFLKQPGSAVAAN